MMSFNEVIRNDSIYQLNEIAPTNEQQLNWHCVTSSVDVICLPNKYNCEVVNEVNSKMFNMDCLSIEEFKSDVVDSNIYQDLVPPCSSHCEIQNPSINSVFDERVSLGYRFVTNDTSGEQSEPKSEEIYEILDDEFANREVSTSAPQNQINFKVELVDSNRKTSRGNDNTTEGATTPNANPAKCAKKSLSQSSKKRAAQAKQPVFSCDNCYTSFSAIKDLQSHYKTSQVCSKQFSCHLCSYSTDQSSTLKLHLAFEHNCT